jgi:hypothetical protein
MKRVLLPLCLIGIAVSGPATLHLEGDGAMSMAIAGNVSFPVSTCVQSTEIVTLQGEQDEVHSVVVDMPQVISLKYVLPPKPGMNYRRFNRMSNLRQHQCCR